ncbi:MAG: PfkB family carbohydrate kinase [Ktedonobacterales bacterium]
MPYGDTLVDAEPTLILSPHQPAEPPFRPDFLVIGHATRDLLPNTPPDAPDGGWRPGGTVLYAASTALRHGLRVGVVTSCPPDLAATLRALLPGAHVQIVPAAQATAFENVYAGNVRQQYLRGRATSLSEADIPPDWRSAPIVLLAPVAQEAPPALAESFPQSLVAATAQGWLRTWERSQRVIPMLLGKATIALPSLQAFFLSREDVQAPYDIPAQLMPHQPRSVSEVEAYMENWASVTPLLVETLGYKGARIRRNGGEPEDFPAYQVEQVDPTGAGDVFAAAFLIRLRETSDPVRAVDYANRVAAISVEGVGVDAIPTRGQVIARFGPLK